MAPKNKFTREEMVAAAVRVVRAKGIDKLTAQALAAELGTSTQPVFTCFSTMDTVKAEVRTAAEALYHAYSSKGLQEDVPFFGFGLQYIRFAKEEPELYRLLFLTPGADGKNVPGHRPSFSHANLSHPCGGCRPLFPRPLAGRSQPRYADCNEQLSLQRCGDRPDSDRLQP